MDPVAGGTSAESGLATVGLLSLILIGLVAVGFGGYYGYKNAPAQELLLEFLGKNVLYMPNVLFGYGFISDIFNNTGYHYSIASITALMGMIINKGLGGIIVGSIATSVSFIADKVRQAPLAAAAVGTAATVALAPVASTALVPAAASTALLPSALASAPAAAAAAAPAIAPAAAAATAATAAAATIAPDLGTGPASDKPFLLTPDILRARMAEDDSVFNLTQLPPNQRGGGIPCSLPGFEWLENTIAPQGIVMSMTILWYLLIELWDNGSSGQSAALGVTTAITFILQWLVMARYGCLTSYRYTVYSPLIALVMAITFAGTSYGIQKAIRGGSSSSSGGTTGTIRPVFSGGVNGTFVCPPGTGLSPDGSQCLPLPGFGGSGEEKVPVGGKSDQSAPVNDQDQFVCEAYKDGELVTSTIVD